MIDRHPILFGYLIALVHVVVVLQIVLVAKS